MNKGDVIKLEYDMWVEDGDKLRLGDTTSEEKAKKEGIYKEGTLFAPMHTIVGANRVLPGLDRSLGGAEAGKEYKIKVNPADGFGEIKPELIHSIPLKEFRKQKVRPKVGMKIRSGDNEGEIIRVTESRAMVNFNHPLAGKTLHYQYRILGKASDDKEKVKWIMLGDYQKFLKEPVELKVENHSCEVELPKVCNTDPGWFFAKLMIVKDLQEYGNMEKVRFIEEFIKEKREKQEDKTGKAEK